MHLLAGEAGRIDDGDGAVDLGQSPGDVVFLSAADSELALLAAAAGRRVGGPAFRLANLMRLAHPLSVDLYAEATLSAARLVVVRLMGGVAYWPYGVDRLLALSRGGGPGLALLPGDDRWDAELAARSSAAAEDCRILWRMLAAGGPDNADAALGYMAHLAGFGARPAEPARPPLAGVYWPGEGAIGPDEAADRLAPGRPVAAVVFYRSIFLGGQTAPVDALSAALAGEGLSPLPVFVQSLRDPAGEAFLAEVFAALPPAIVLNATAFSAARAGAEERTILDRPGRPVLQVVFAGTSEAAWRESRRGLGAKDLTMNVVLPEVDGRILTRAVSFKAETHDAATDSRITAYRPVPDRVRTVAAQAAAWVRLGARPAKERRVAIVLSNYPNRDGRIANAVGLDALESAVRLAAAMRAAGYAADGFPDDGRQLANALVTARGEPVETAGAACRDDFDELPKTLRHAVVSRWGEPRAEPVAALRFGNVAVAIQPSRGYDVDPKASYHDPDLPPPHEYLAFHAWLRRIFRADAVVHLGKHGNLEWLPGKALGLSAECWPEAALGPTPVIYPFIVNDPGEGAQAKRRLSAAIVDHLTPPMTRAETYGPLAELETLIDEYYLAAGVDPRRRKHLEAEILAAAARTGLDRDLGIRRDEAGEAMQKLDAHLCELKEMQIRDGLHILGAAPVSRQRIDALIAIARTPRPGGTPADASLLRALATDLGLGFDPLDCDLAAPWSGPRPEDMARQSGAPWRSAGDTVERLEALAVAVLAARLGRDEAAPVAATPPAGPATAAVLDWIAKKLAPALDASGPAEIRAVLAGLDGRFIPPGPSGAPSRGRPEALPTGRNFFTVDVRGVPTAAAWTLGRKAADALALRYFQDEGEWPRAIALSAWSTSAMRTGGDDIAQAMALIGARPVWETGTGRVTGFAILSLSELGRPRIDVTLKISGMFRDAFPGQIDLLDSAMRAVAALDEDATANPLVASPHAPRIFGPRPGAFGAGLQTLVDESVWTSRADLADAFLAWGGHAWGPGVEGEPAQESFARRLSDVDAVLQNRDNVEHDILDSDEYWQFHGGLAAAVERLRGVSPRLYLGDNARPETPVVRPLAEEIGRVVRGRAANPKWIAGVMRHGYRGGAEIAATVDLLFAWAAATDAPSGAHFDALYDAYLGDPAVRDFLATENPAALAEIAARFREAIGRGLWSPRSNSAQDALAALAAFPEAAQ